MQRIFLIGFMGSGKSSMGRLLARTNGLNFIDLDAYIENKYHLGIADIFAQEGEEGFRLKERTCLHEVAYFENVVIATGGGAPCFFDNMALMNKQGETIYLRLTPEHLAVRLSAARSAVRPLVRNKSGAELLQYITKTLQQREPYYLQATHIVEGTDDEIEKWFATKI